MKMENQEAADISKQYISEDGYSSQCESYHPSPGAKIGLQEQSSLAEIHRQQQQLLQQFSLLQRNIAQTNNNLSGSSIMKTSHHPLFSHGSCRWAGCEVHCQTLQHFYIHLERCHALNDKSTAQTKVQTQIVEQLEQQLYKEQQRLSAMMEHLKKARQWKEEEEEREEDPDSPGSQLCLPLLSSTSSNGFHGPSSKLASQAGPIRKRPSKSEEGSTNYQRFSRSERLSGQDVESEMTDNRDFYLSQDVRPPFTYAALIRQAINTSRERRLTLNQIYNWFQANFAFFQRNAATWKNAVRHNLSLHKCFSRVENVKGAVWTVDEVEFHRRRPQRNTDSQTSQSSSPPTCPTVYDDSFNRTLQTALLNIGKTGEHYLASFGAVEEQNRPPVSPPRMVEYQRFPTQSHGLEENELHHNKSAMPGLEEVESSEQNSLASHNMEDQLDKDQEALPQDLSMMSCRNGDR